MKRRVWLMALAAGIMIAAVAAQKRHANPPVQVFRITFGLKDEKPAQWDGEITVADGEVVALEGWRFEGKDAIVGKTGWKAGTHEYIAPGERYKLETPGEPPPKVKTSPWPNAVDVTVKGSKPTLAIAFAQGKMEFGADAIKLGEPQTFLDGAVRVERLPEVKILRPADPPNAKDARQDDYPAFWIRYRTNKHYLAWVCYQKGKDRILLVERDGPDGELSEPIEVAGPGDHFRVAMASTHNDDLWVVWSSQVGGNWDLYGRKYAIGDGAAKPLGEAVRLTEDPGPDIWHRMTTDNKGRAWLVWQGARNGQFDIFARCADENGWQKPIKVSEGTGNNWDPCIAADTKKDRVWVGWDTYQDGYYDVRIRRVEGGAAAELGPTERLKGPWTQAAAKLHVNLACTPDGELWAAWDQDEADWGKDAGLLWQIDKQFASAGKRLYNARQVILATRDDKAREWTVRNVEWSNGESCELPQLQVDSTGSVCMAYRKRSCRRPREDGWAAQARWDWYVGKWYENTTLYLEASPIPLPSSNGRNDMRMSSQRDRDGNVYFAFATDNRGWLPPAMTEKNLGIGVCRISWPPRKSQFGGGGPSVSSERPKPPVHPNEAAQVARIRSYEVKRAGKTYHIYRGDLHRHTDISGDGVGDGSLMDFHRYAHDAAALDFAMVTDHNMGNDREYPWWRTQKANDLYTIPGKFISMYGYERSVRYPNGHRNIIWTERGHRTLPLPNQAIPAQMAADTGKLYAYLRETGGICTAHSSATEQGTDWKDFDPALEPIVEIFQGFQSSYEMDGAPLAIDTNMKIVHQGFRPDGFINKALDKGYRLGFQCSSDHVSTHVSYACVLAEEFSRQGLVEAMKKRHTYGATDNIIVDFRAGQLGIMGDEIAANEPRFDVTVIGTAPLDYVDIIRNGKVAHTAKPEKESEELRLSWQDPSPEKGKTSYYYVRVVQKNKHMAWASPIWVKGE